MVHLKRLIKTETLDIFPWNNGFIYAEKINVSENRVKINYYSYSFDTESTSPFTKSAYLLSKFGNAFKPISKQLGNYITCGAGRFPDKRVMVVYSTGEAGMFGEEGELIWTGDLLYHGSPVKDIIADKKHFWCVVPKDNSIVRFQLKNMSADFRIGGGNASCFDCPQSIWKEGNLIYVANAGSKRIRIVNIKDYSVKDYLQFEENIWKYMRIGEHEVVMLNSGIYEL